MEICQVQSHVKLNKLATSQMCPERQGLPILDHQYQAERPMQESWQNYALLNTTPVQVGTNGSIFSGTGFFVLWQTQEGTALFLVSNKHVL